MKNDIVESKKKHPIPALFEQLEIPAVKPSDRFTLTYRDGLLKAHVKRSSGQSVSAVKRVKGGFVGFTQFDPDQMSRTDRNELIRSMYAKGVRQKELEGTFGLTQSMISRIVRS